jgi:hypothetical protein
MFYMPRLDFQFMLLESTNRIVAVALIVPIPLYYIPIFLQLAKVCCQPAEKSNVQECLPMIGRFCFTSWYQNASVNRNLGNIKRVQRTDDGQAWLVSALVYCW